MLVKAEVSGGVYDKAKHSVILFILDCIRNYSCLYMYMYMLEIIVAHMRRKETDDIKTLKSSLLHIPLLICTIKCSVSVYHKQRVNC